MNALRSLALLLLVPLLLAGCGDADGDRRDRAREASDDPSQASEDEDAGTGQELEEAPPLEEPTNPGDRTGAATFALTPAIQGCMEQAGFTQDAPPTAALAAWRHPSGGRVVVASTDEASVTGGIADEIGTRFAADVEGSIVVAAPEAPAEAARTCLDG